MSKQNGTGGGEKLIVKAIFRFKGTNNDELRFKKGDLITVTQREDGGWWEGTTLDGKTGWFPSNYVAVIEEEKVIKEVDDGGLDQDLVARQIDYRQQVIKDFHGKEIEFVNDLQSLQKSYLVPLHRMDILSESEFRQLVGNLDEVMEVHRRFSESIGEMIKLRPREQRIGKVFLEHGAVIKSAHYSYWENHPKAVCILEKHREALDSFMEGLGASNPGLIALTTALSKPFRHLEKYSGICQELEQHLEDDHPDRGDTQRSIGFYKNVASECAKVRRQKELELEVLTGTIRGWEGEDLSTFGDIIFMGSVAIGSEHKDRYFVLFHSYLLILSVSSRMSAFIYEGKLPLSGISANRLEDIESVRNSFEITGPMIDRIVVMCQTKAESLKWVELIRSQIKASRNTNTLPMPPPHKTAPMSPMAQNKRPQNIGENSKKCLWKMSCLRPAPPTRSYLSQDGRRNNNKKKDSTYEEDMQILRVIEAYCTSGKQRQTCSASALIENAPVLLVEEDKLNRKSSGSHHGIEDRSVIELVESLKEQVVQLGEQNNILTKKIEEESAARKKLVSLLKATVLQNVAMDLD